MDKLAQIQKWTETLQKQVIGEPQWMKEKGVFEYPEVTVEVVSILKLIRAVQSLRALELLCENGLFVDMQAIYRCVADCTNEIHFLLENYPSKSSKVEKFIENFSQTTIDQYLTPETEPIPTRKVHNAVARSLTGSENNHQIQETVRRIHKTFSGYVHSNYSHIMEIYGGSRGNRSFNLGGVPSKEQKRIKSELIESAKISVQYAIAFMAATFNQRELFLEINNQLTGDSSVHD